MAKLLRRVRGESESARPVVTHLAKPRTEPTTVPVVEDPTDEVEDDEPAAADVLAEPFKMVPRAQAPELTSNLRAMRDLANWSAQQAIDTSVRQRWGKAAIGKMAVAATGIVVGGALWYWSEDAFDATFLAAMLAFVVAVFWGLQGGIIFRNILQAWKLMPRPRAHSHAVGDEPHDEQNDVKPAFEKEGEDRAD
jgi:hypothetical protein